MPAPPQIDIVAPKRVPFDETIDDERGDYTGATFAMQIRAEPGDTGAPVLTLGNYISGQGILATYEEIPDPSDPTGVDLIWASRVRIRILEATLEAIGLSADTADDLRLYYDLHVTPIDITKFIMCRGRFTISPGVTL